MYDLHSEMFRFYDEHVRLSDQEKVELIEKRDLNIQRLESGLETLQDSGVRLTGPLEATIDQGGLAMGTLVQHPSGEHDLDTALVFHSDNLPSSPLEARKRIADALLAAAGSFAREPEARTNAVTVWYTAGYHIDMAVYRIVGSMLEHAGTDWTELDPNAVRDWFERNVAELSPQPGFVEAEQLRRISCLLKAFSRSRASWKCPGGLILSALAVECYEPNEQRDDVSLYETLEAIYERLESDDEIEHPLAHLPDLTDKYEYLSKVRNLRDHIGEAMEKLEVLFESDCTRPQAVQAWDYVFRNEYWKSELDEEVGDLDLSVDVAHTEGGEVIYGYDGHAALPKDVHLRFEIVNFRVEPDDEVLWIVTNSGVEAEEAEDLGHETSGNGTQWERTAYRGLHQMECEVYRNDTLIAAGSVDIRIGPK